MDPFLFFPIIFGGGSSNSHIYKKKHQHDASEKCVIAEGFYADGTQVDGAHDARAGIGRWSLQMESPAWGSRKSGSQNIRVISDCRRTSH